MAGLIGLALGDEDVAAAGVRVKPKAVTMETGQWRLQVCGRRFQNGTMNVTLKNVPDPVYNGMKREAKRNRRSLNAEMIRTLEEKVAEAERRRNLKQLIEKVDRFAASLPPMPDSAPLIRRERERH